MGFFKALRAGMRVVSQELAKDKYAKAQQTLATLNPDGSKKQVVVIVVDNNKR